MVTGGTHRCVAFPTSQRIHTSPQPHGEIPRPVCHVAHLTLQFCPLDIYGLGRNDFMNFKRLQQRHQLVKFSEHFQKTTSGR